MRKQAEAQLAQAQFNRIATALELDATLKAFEAECWRDDPARLARATEAAHAALQASLDAIHSNLALAKRAHGL